jgi:hypothetical protein
MLRSQRWFVGLGIVSFLFTAVVTAEEIRFYEKDGVTYRETRRTTMRPVSETRYEDRKKTVYRHELISETRPSYRTYNTPVTEYQLRSYWVGRWNPFVQPSVGYRYVPCTRWETHTQVVDVPVLRSEWVADTRTVKVPVTTRRMVEEEVITRVVVSPSTSSDTRYARSDGASVSVARRDRIGGTRLENDPPRASTSGWRAASDTIRR